jgi:hypothetical protein
MFKLLYKIKSHGLGLTWGRTGRTKCFPTL